jgi:DNA-binding SARP family transcriptional activator
MQATIGLAICLHRQKNMQAMIEKVHKAVALAEKHGYKLICVLELQRSPALIQTIQSIPTTAQLYARLCGSTEVTQNSLTATVSPIQKKPAPSSHTHRQPSLRILALGEPEVYVNNVPVKRWRMSQVTEVFFLLLNAGKPVHKEQICAALWPEADNQPDQALRSSIYYLRKILGNACIVSKGGTYALKLDNVFNTQVWYDVQAFRDSYAIARAALAANDDGAARSAFNEMTLLYRGDYVSSFYTNWCAPIRSELKDAYTDAHHQLALVAWRSRQFDECISHWHHLLTIDPCLEEAHYGLINCYHQMGKRGMALRQYQRCVTILNDELAVSPGPAIMELYQTVLASD